MKRGEDSAAPGGHAWRGVLWLVVASLALPVRGSEPATPEALPPEPLVQAAPAPGPTPWRALAEEGVFLGVGLLGYAVTRPPAQGAYPVPILDKLRLVHGAWGFDADSISMNYLGHPVGGLFFYQVARGNRLGVGPSLGLTLLTATAWEFAEYQELVSAHDVISTTAGGFALGEAFGQLATWIGEGEGGASRGAGMLLQIPRAFHDWVDGAPRAPRVRWGRADVSTWGGAGLSQRSEGGREGEVTVGARALLIRAAALGAPGQGWQALLDGEVTSLAGELSFGRNGVVGIDLSAQASLAGLYGRDLDAAGEGGDLLLCLGFGYDYLRRAEPAGATWANDYLVLVRTPGGQLAAGLRRGAVRVELGLEAALTLGAVQPLALLGQSGDLPGAPGVLRMGGYYHGLGLLLAPRATVAAGPVVVEASLRLDRLQAIQGNDVAPPAGGGRLSLEDERKELRVGLRWRPLARPVLLLAEWRRRERWGRAGAATASLVDSTATLGLGVGY